MDGPNKLLAEVKTSFDRLDKRQDLQDRWINEVQGDMAEVKRAASITPGGSSRIKHAIPQRFNETLEMAERHGIKNAVDVVARDVWWHLKFMEPLAGLGKVSGRAGDYRTEAENMERAWGDDPDRRVEKGAQGEVIGGGGNIIATPVETELRRLIRDNSIAEGLAGHIVMQSLTHQLPVENANVVAYIVAEAGTIGDSFVTTGFSQVALTARKFAGLATVSNELLEDNIIGLNDYILTAVAESIGLLQDGAAFDGAAAGTVFTGIASVVGRFTSNASAQSGGSIPTYAELCAAAYAAQQSASRMNARWFMRPYVWQSILASVSTDGIPIVTVGRVPEGVPERLLGYPVSLVSAISITQTLFTSSTSIYFGPPQKIIFGDLGRVRFDLDPYSRLDTYETRLRVVKRTGITIPVGAYFSQLQGVKYQA